MSATLPLERIAVGVVVERRKAKSPWIDFTWHPVGVLAGVPDAAAWTVLSSAGDVTTFYTGSTQIALYRTETANYLSNLAAAIPMLWVALRPTGVEPPYDIVAVTADPAEGESFTQVGDDVVDTVPMPRQLRDIIERFAVEHHVDQPFLKRKRDRADPEALAQRAPKDRRP